MLPHSHWRISLERLDNRSGYSRSNCVLIAAEFNTSDHSGLATRSGRQIYGTAQWSRKKVAAISQMRNMQVDVTSLAKSMEDAKVRPRYSGAPRPPRRKPNMLGEWMCCICSFFFFPRDAFHKNSSRSSGIDSACKQCRTQVSLRYQGTLRGISKTRVAAAHSRSLEKGLDCAITYHDVLDM